LETLNSLTLPQKPKIIESWWKSHQNDPL